MSKDRVVFDGTNCNEVRAFIGPASGECEGDSCECRGDEAFPPQILLWDDGPEIVVGDAVVRDDNGYTFSVDRAPR